MQLTLIASASYNLNRDESKDLLGVFYPRDTVFLESRGASLPLVVALVRLLQTPQGILIFRAKVEGIGLLYANE